MLPWLLSGDHGSFLFLWVLDTIAIPNLKTAGYPRMTDGRDSR
jgi:hypothetical protein